MVTPASAPSSESDGPANPSPSIDIGQLDSSLNDHSFKDVAASDASDTQDYQSFGQNQQSNSDTSDSSDGSDSSSLSDQDSKVAASVNSASNTADSVGTSTAPSPFPPSGTGGSPDGYTGPDWSSGGSGADGSELYNNIDQQVNSIEQVFPARSRRPAAWSW